MHPVLSRSLALLAGWAALVVVTAGAVWLVSELAGETVRAADRFLLRGLHRASIPWLKTGAHALSDLGKPAAIVPLTVFATLATWGAGRPRGAFWIALSSFGAGAAYMVLVRWIARDRPDMFVDVSGYSLPSGHVVATLSMALPTGIVAWRRSRWRSWPVQVPLFLLVVIISLARPYIQYHWVSDVVLAWVLTGVWVWWVDRVLPRPGEGAPRRGG